MLSEIYELPHKIAVFCFPVNTAHTGLSRKTARLPFRANWSKDRNNKKPPFQGGFRFGN